MLNVTQGVVPLWSPIVWVILHINAYFWCRDSSLWTSFDSRWTITRLNFYASIIAPGRDLIFEEVVNVFIAHLIKPITQAQILWFWSVLFSQKLRTIKQPRPWPISLGFRRAIKAIGILMEFFVWAKRFDVNDFLLVLSFMTVVFVRGYVMIAQSWFFVNCEKPTLKAN